MSEIPRRVRVIWADNRKMKLTVVRFAPRFRGVNLNINTLLLTSALLLRSAVVGC